MTTPPDNDARDRDGLYGPSDSDIERYGSEEYEETLLEHRRRASSAFWKLLAGAVFILFAASMVLNVFLPALTGNSGPNPPERVNAQVTRVVDGRTINVEVDGVEHAVRYIGVETPLPGERFHDEAIAANEMWLSGRAVELEADAQDKDPQGRLLRYVWLDNAMVNLDMVGVGLARTEEGGPNDRYESLFRQLEESAHAQGLGIWSQQVEQPTVALTRTAVVAAGEPRVR